MYMIESSAGRFSSDSLTAGDGDAAAAACKNRRKMFILGLVFLETNLDIAETDDIPLFDLSRLTVSDAAAINKRAVG